MAEPRAKYRTEIQQASSSSTRSLSTPMRPSQSAVTSIWASADQMLGARAATPRGQPLSLPSSTDPKQAHASCENAECTEDDHAHSPLRRSPIPPPEPVDTAQDLVAPHRHSDEGADTMEGHGPCASPLEPDATYKTLADGNPRLDLECSVRRKNNEARPPDAAVAAIICNPISLEAHTQPSVHIQNVQQAPGRTLRNLVPRHQVTKVSASANLNLKPPPSPLSAPILLLPAASSRQSAPRRPMTLATMVAVEVAKANQLYESQRSSPRTPASIRTTLAAEIARTNQLYEAHRSRGSSTQRAVAGAARGLSGSEPGALVYRPHTVESPTPARRLAHSSADADAAEQDHNILRSSPPKKSVSFAMSDAADVNTAPEHTVHDYARLRAHQPVTIKVTRLSQSPTKEAATTRDPALARMELPHEMTRLKPGQPWYRGTILDVAC
ncbi:hypothetical protein LTR53_009014 [Teratosphaeriaceae sp. CCFEE 6253]|nr:hypothetical protein LTR53_009014 [Teratosphaeriaceae sp. CCFEE 6253]